MSEKMKNRMLPLVMAMFIGGMCLVSVFTPDKEYSNAERRRLAGMPELSVETIWNGRFMKDFESYTLDQFPLRETFRSIKASAELSLFGKKTVNGYYTVEESISKLEYPMNTQMLDNAVNKFDYLYETYLLPENIEPYLVMVPDKNYSLAEDNGYLSMDYEELFSYVTEAAPYMNNIEIADLLSAEDYYLTDTHWRQEKIVDVAEYIAEQMGTELCDSYVEKKLEEPFYGVYFYQSALGSTTDELIYLTSDVLDNCIVTYYDFGTPKEGDLYNLKKAAGNDAYEIFLSGAAPVVSIENPDAVSGKELVIFRDSFGSSMAPLLVSGYEKITLVDIRYVQSSSVGDFVDFSDCDVLFLYSTMLLNNSGALR